MLLFGLIAAPICLVLWLVWPKFRTLWNNRSARREPSQLKPYQPSIQPQQAPALPPRQSTVTVQPAPVRPSAATRPTTEPPKTRLPGPMVQPPSSLGLDEPDSIRPDISPLAVHQTRDGLAHEVPDALLADALLDATPEQIKLLIGAVPAEVMAGIMGHGPTFPTQSASSRESAPTDAEARKDLKGLETAVDDLDIWSFGLQD